MSDEKKTKKQHSTGDFLRHLADWHDKYKKWYIEQEFPQTEDNEDDDSGGNPGGPPPPPPGPTGS